MGGLIFASTSLLGSGSELFVCPPGPGPVTYGTNSTSDGNALERRRRPGDADDVVRADAIRAETPEEGGVTVAEDATV